MTNDTETPLNAAAITSAAAKLAAFAQTLAPEERAVLAQVIAQAALMGQDRDEVTGYTIIKAGPGQLSLPSPLELLGPTVLPGVLTALLLPGMQR